MQKLLSCLNMSNYLIVITQSLCVKSEIYKLFLFHNHCSFYNKLIWCEFILIITSLSLTVILKLSRKNIIGPEVDFMARDGFFLVI